MMKNFGEHCDILRNVFIMLIQIYQNELNPFACSCYLTGASSSLSTPVLISDTESSNKPGLHHQCPAHHVRVNSRCQELGPGPQKFLPSSLIS